MWYSLPLFSLSLSLNLQFIPPLSIILRLTKSLFFSSPDNSPDIDSIIRLFTHESIRIVVDSLPEELHSTVYQVILPFHSKITKTIQGPDQYHTKYIELQCKFTIRESSHDRRLLILLHYY